PSRQVLLVVSLMFAAGVTAAALMPSYFLFGAVLFVIGISVQTITTTTSTLVQTSTELAMRGRGIAIMMAIIFGGTPIGSPIAGFIADHFGPRWAICFGAASGIVAALAAGIYLWKTKRAATTSAE